MFRFEKEQSVWDFNGTKIGGQPGSTRLYWVRLSSTTSTSACLMTRQERSTRQRQRLSGTAARSSRT